METADGARIVVAPVTVTLMVCVAVSAVDLPSVAVTDGKVKLDAKFKVDRTRFGMNYQGQPDDPINAEVDIEILVGGE